MKRLGLIIVLLLIGCTPRPQSSLVKSGTQSINVVQQFSRLIPTAIHGVGHYEGVGSELKWRSVGGLYGRYVVRMQFPVSVSWLTGQMHKTGPAEFMIMEIDSVKTIPGGLRAISLTSNKRSFSEPDWAQIVAASGDWSAIHFPMTKDAPVDRFDEALKSQE